VPLTTRERVAAKYRACPGDVASSQPIADNREGILTGEQHSQLHTENNISVRDCATTVSDNYIYKISVLL